MPDQEEHLTAHDETIVLRIVGGPDSGREYPLETSEVTLGRSSSCDIAVADNMLSRQHVRVIRNGLDWDVVDLGSTNGTWLKGERLSGRSKLPCRVPVRIGQTLFELYGGSDNSEILDEKLIAYREAAISSGNLSNLNDERDSNARILAAIYKFQALMSEEHAKIDLYAKILELISDTVHSDHAYFLVWSDDEQQMIPVAERNKYGVVNPVSSDHLSYSIIDYVRENNQAIISMDVQTDDRFQGESIAGSDVSSVMCVPMMGRNASCGMIYVISTSTDKKYRQNELKLLNVIGHSAAMALENLKLIEGNIKSQRMAAIGMTAASLSHYVKNILNGLEGSISLLRMGIDNGDKTVMNQAWDILSNNEKRLSTLMLDLLSLAKDQKPDFAKYNISEIIMDAADLLRQQCKDENITLAINDDLAKNPIHAEVDGQGVHRVILNLVNNAIDAIKEVHLESNEGRISIAVEVDPRRQEFDICVSDNGKGIPVENQEKIFDEFQTGKAVGGTGLGLAVTRKIVDGHNGRIELESRVEKGSRFHVILPLSQDVNRTQTLKVSGVRDSQKMSVTEEITPDTETSSPDA